MIIHMPQVEKVTVSLPASLLEFVESLRTETGATRSAVIVDLLSEMRRQVELAEREARYAAAYEEQPETDSETRSGYAASAVLFANAGEEWREDAEKAAGRAPG